MASLPILITLGDPAGIGPEIVLKALGRLPESHGNADFSALGAGDFPRLRIIAYPTSLASAARAIGLSLELSSAGVSCSGLVKVWKTSGLPEIWEPTDALREAIAQRGLAIDARLAKDASKLGSPESPLVPGVVGALSGLQAAEAVASAAELCLQGFAFGICTGPLNKEAIRAANIPCIGHTELLGGLAGVADPLTMFQTGSLRIFFLTRHVSLRKAVDLVTRERLEASILQCLGELKKLGIATPRLVVAALNPHGGEHGLFGDEEDRIMTPLIEELKARGLNVDGPVGADSVFHLARIGRWDAVLSLYHDQGHIAAKTLDFDGTISMTLGLPFLRSSVDHGTAFDIAGKGKARARGMSEALRAALGYLAATDGSN